MDFHGFLRSRRSTRRFKPIPVDAGILNHILETATHAPSAHNRQPWRFVVITHQQPKSRLAEGMAADFQQVLAGDGVDPGEIQKLINRSKTRINESPVVIVLCMDMSEMDIYPDPAGTRAKAEEIMAIQSVAAAGLQLQLAARAEGLDSVWTCGPLFAQETVKKALALPDEWQPQAMFFVGYGAEPPKEKTLKKLSEVVKFL